MVSEAFVLHDVWNIYFNKCCSYLSDILLLYIVGWLRASSDPEIHRLVYKALFNLRNVVTTHPFRFCTSSELGEEISCVKLALHSMLGLLGKVFDDDALDFATLLPTELDCTGVSLVRLPAIVKLATDIRKDIEKMADKRAEDGFMVADCKSIVVCLMHITSLALVRLVLTLGTLFAGLGTGHTGQQRHQVA